MLSRQYLSARPLISNHLNQFTANPLENVPPGLKFQIPLFVSLIFHYYYYLLLLLSCYCCYYYYYLYHHSLCWCSFCASAGRKPCTWGISHSSQSFCSDTKHLSGDSRRSHHADLLNLCHSSSFCYFLDVFYHPLPYCTKRTNNYSDHYGFHLPHSLYF